jgi:hypothetical protein
VAPAGHFELELETAGFVKDDQFRILLETASKIAKASNALRRDEPPASL